MNKIELWDKLYNNYYNYRKCGFCENKFQKMITVKKYYLDYQDNELLTSIVERTMIIHLCKNCFLK